MNIRLADLDALLTAAKTIRKLSPNTGNVQAFKFGIANLSNDDCHALAMAIDTASIAVSAVERALVPVDA